MREAIIRATERALLKPVQQRFLQTERGFQGVFYAALLWDFLKSGIVDEARILEMEYQKGARHDIRQRPDIILHVPVEYSGEDVDKNNYAVWALKRCASAKEAFEDFAKLDQTFGRLNYPLGIFVNIDTEVHCAEAYQGPFPDRVHTVAVWSEGEVKTAWGRPPAIEGAAI